MKKVILALMIVAIAMPAFASETRIRTLGHMIAPYIEDDANVWTWYATLPSYANLVTITAGYEDVYIYGDDTGWYNDYIYAKFGLTYGLGEENKYGVLGLWWEETTLGPLFGHETWGPYDYNTVQFDEWVYNKWNVMWGYQMDGIAFGLYFNRADNGEYVEGTWGDEDIEGEMHEAYTTLGLGVRFDIGEAMYADVAFDYTMVNWTYLEPEDVDAENEITEDANSMMGFRGRLFYEWTDMITWVPYVNYRMGDFSVKSSNDEYYGDFDCWGFKGFHFDLGLGANIQVNDETMLILAVEPYGMAKAEPSECGAEAGESSLKATLFPGMAFGFESDVRDWLTFRAGCDKVFVKWTEEYEGDIEGEDGSIEYKSTSAPFNWFLGVGLHVGDFDIDAMVNKEVPFSMGYWLTGFQPYNGYDSGAPIGMISATYHF
ncbi:MAG: hypothetical protein PHQ19_00725 [Candidatus Krumholzibacteria bacterium]|nr:hypothetical protein [Candidatus Krumholzibacteria bacterium]